MFLFRITWGHEVVKGFYMYKSYVCFKMTDFDSFRHFNVKSPRDLCN